MLYKIKKKIRQGWTEKEEVLLINRLICNRFVKLCFFFQTRRCWGSSDLENPVVDFFFFSKLPLKHFVDERITLFCSRFTPTVSTSVQWWWSTRPTLDALTKEWPQTGWRINWSLTMATNPPFRCTSASLSFVCPSKPPTQSLWLALELESLPLWASSRREAGSKSKVFTDDFSRK